MAYSSLEPYKVRRIPPTLIQAVNMIPYDVLTSFPQSSRVKIWTFYLNRNDGNKDVNSQVSRWSCLDALTDPKSGAKTVAVNDWMFTLGVNKKVICPFWTETHTHAEHAPTRASSEWGLNTNLVRKCQEVIVGVILRLVKCQTHPPGLQFAP